MEAAVLREVVADPAELEFAHAVLRDMCYERLSNARRLQLHHSAALHLASRPEAPAEIIGHHMHEARQLAGWDLVATWAHRAGDSSATRLDYAVAIEWFTRGLAAITPGHPATRHRGELLVSKGRIERRAGLDRARETLAMATEEADRLNDAGMLADAALAWNRGFYSRSLAVDFEQVALLRRAADLLDSREVDRRAEVYAALGAELVWAHDGDARFELSDRAVALARQSSNLPTLARVLELRCLTIACPEKLGDRLETTAELLEITGPSDDMGQFRAQFHRGGALIEAGDVAGANAAVRLASALADQLHQPNYRWQARVVEASTRLHAGDLTNAELLADEARDLGRAVGSTFEAQMFRSLQLLEIRRAQGRLSELVKPTNLASFTVDPSLTMLRHLLDAGYVDEARRHYDAVRPQFMQRARRDLLAGTVESNVAYLASRFEDVEVARAMYEAREPFPSHVATGIVTQPVASHYLGLTSAAIGRLDAADEHFRAAVELQPAELSPVHRCESLLELATLQFRLDHRDEGQALVREAADVARSCGANWFVEWGRQIQHG